MRSAYLRCSRVHGAAAVCGHLSKYNWATLAAPFTAAVVCGTQSPLGVEECGSSEVPAPTAAISDEPWEIISSDAVLTTPKCAEASTERRAAENRSHGWRGGLFKSVFHRKNAVINVCSETQQMQQFAEVVSQIARMPIIVTPDVASRVMQSYASIIGASYRNRTYNVFTEERQNYAVLERTGRLRSVAAASEWVMEALFLAALQVSRSRLEMQDFQITHAHWLKVSRRLSKSLGCAQVDGRQAKRGSAVIWTASVTDMFASFIHHLFQSHQLDTASVADCKRMLKACDEWIASADATVKNHEAAALLVYCVVVSIMNRFKVRRPELEIWMRVKDHLASCLQCQDFCPITLVLRKTDIAVDADAVSINAQLQGENFASLTLRGELRMAQLPWGRL